MLIPLVSFIGGLPPGNHSKKQKLGTTYPSPVVPG